MARLWTSGAEGLDANAAIIDGSPTLSANVTYDTATKLSGAASWKGAPPSLANPASVESPTVTWVVGTTYYLKFSLMFPAIPTGTWGMGVLNLNNDANDLSVQLVSGVLRGSMSAVGGVTINANQWYCVELASQTNSGASSSYRELRVNGQIVYTTSVRNITTVTASTALVGTLSAGQAGQTFYIDDIILNDSTGSAPVNTWPGDSRVLMLKPASDSAVGTGWTDDAASATGLFDAVNVLPPRGIADTTGSTGLHQIRNATSNASVSYDANLTTYTAAGVGDSDTVNTVQAFTSTGAPVTTGSKQGLVGMASNPAITTIALSATGTSGAFWNGTTAGTYPTGWKWSAGTMATAPTVTLGSAPVARVTQVTSSTRIAMVDFLGAQIDYTTAYSNQLLADVTVARTRT